MVDGLFYQDTREPFITADLAPATLLTTGTALYLATGFPTLGAGYFNQRIGKKIKIEMFGKMTTDGTPGNSLFTVFWGTGASGNGTSLATSTSTAMTISQTSLSWWLTLTVRSTTLGSSGALEVMGMAVFNESLLAARHFIPASAAAPTTADLTANNIISVQYQRSGVGVWTMTVQDLTVTALN